MLPSYFDEFQNMAALTLKSTDMLERKQAQWNALEGS